MTYVRDRATFNIILGGQTDWQIGRQMDIRKSYTRSLLFKEFTWVLARLILFWKWPIQSDVPKNTRCRISIENILECKYLDYVQTKTQSNTFFNEVW